MENIFLDSNPFWGAREIANLVGANGAIAIQQIHFWCNKNKKHNRNFYKGRYWTYNTYEDWQENCLTWLSVSGIKKCLTTLEKDGYIISDNFNKIRTDRTKWYSINYDKLSADVNANEQRRLEAKIAKEQSRIDTKCLMEQIPSVPSVPEYTYQINTGKEYIVQNDSVLNLREETRAREDEKRKANKERIDELNKIFSKPENSSYLELVNKYVDKWYPSVMCKEHPQLGKPLRMEHALVFKDFVSQAGSMDFEDLVDILLFAVQRGGEYAPELKKPIDPTLAWITTKQVLGYCAVKAGFDYAQIQYTDYDFNKETRGIM